MDASPATLDEFKMLDRVGDVDQPPVDARLFQRVIQQLSRGPDERAADDVFLIAWLFTDEHHQRAAWTFAEHGLCRWSAQFATLAVTRFRREIAGMARGEYNG